MLLPVLLLHGLLIVCYISRFPPSCRWHWNALTLVTFTLSCQCIQGVKKNFIEERNSLNFAHLSRQFVAVFVVLLSDTVLDWISWCYRWVERLEEEFFLQGDAEKAHGTTVSPLFDRTKKGITRSQVVFRCTFTHSVRNHFSPIVHTCVLSFNAIINNNNDHGDLIWGKGEPALRCPRHPLLIDNEINDIRSKNEALAIAIIIICMHVGHVYRGVGGMSMFMTHPTTIYACVKSLSHSPCQVGFFDVVAIPLFRYSCLQVTLVLLQLLLLDMLWVFVTE